MKKQCDENRKERKVLWNLAEEFIIDDFSKGCCDGIRNCIRVIWRVNER